MNTPFRNFVLGVGNQARQQLEQSGALTIQNSLWLGAANYDELIDAAAIATEADFVAAGITKAQLDAAIYALEQIRGIINSAAESLSILSQI